MRELEVYECPELDEVTQREMLKLFRQYLTQGWTREMEQARKELIDQPRRRWRGKEIDYDRN